MVYHISLYFHLLTLYNIEGIRKLFPTLCAKDPEFITFSAAPHDENKIQGPLRVTLFLLIFCM